MLETPALIQYQWGKPIVNLDSAWMGDDAGA